MKLFATVHNFQSGQRFSIWSDIGSSRPGVSLTNLNHITLIRAKCCYFTDVEVGVAWFSLKIHTTSLYPGKDLDKLEGPLWFAQRALFEPYQSTISGRRGRAHCPPICLLLLSTDLMIIDFLIPLPIVRYNHATKLENQQ